MTLLARDNDANRRLDRILRKSLPGCPLSFINRLLREKSVYVNGTPRPGNYRISSGDSITLPGVEAETSPPNTKSKPAVDCHLNILYEDNDLLAVWKPKGLLTHGVSSLEEAVRFYLSERIAPSLSFKPGPLHRLDRNTSGIIVFGKSLEGARNFTQALREGRVKKRYRALVDGEVLRTEVWEDRLARDGVLKKTYSSPAPPAKTALTRVFPLETRQNGANTQSLLDIEIDTGRSHQIRAQCAIHGHPLCGDKKYGGGKRKDGYFLCAYKLESPMLNVEAEPVED